MLHRVYWQLGGPAMRAAGPDAVLRGAPAVARIGGRLRAWPGVDDGVRRAFPDATDAFVAQVVRRDAARRVRTAVERLVLPRLDRAALDRLVDLSGVELLLDGPAIVVQGHTGVHGLPGLALALRGVPLTVHAIMVDDGDLPGARGFSQARRRALEESLPGIRYLYATGPGTIARCREVLDAGRVLLGVPDGATSLDLVPGRHRTIPFFGLPVRWPAYAFDLAADAHVPVCALLIDSSRHRHRLEVVALDPADPQRDFVARYEALIRRAPGQWQFWDRLRPGELLP